MKSDKDAPLPLILLLTAAVFLPNFHANFIWDDRLLVLENPWTSKWSTILDIWRQHLWYEIPGEHRSNWYRPVMALHLIIDEKFFGGNLFPRQLLSLGWHLTAVYLGFSYFKRWNIQGGALFFSLSLFAMHPIQMEVNRFIAARNDSMVLVFALAAVLCKNNWGRWVLFFLALTTKESALLLIPILL